MVENKFLKDSEVKLVDEYATEKLISGYKNAYDIDVDYLFKGYKTVQTYECIKTGYRFYYPFDIAGDSKFYEKFQEFDWYYMPWKWEHQLCEEYIKNGDSILEVGCGQAAFMKNLLNRHDKITCKGLELNESSTKKEDRLEVVNQTIEDYSLNNKNKYDLVCSFQVLEHIEAVHSFIKGKVECVRKGGLMVICVPNNDSFIKFDKHGLLNMPPHHMSLWNEKSLTAVCDLFDLELVDVKFEPLMDYHYGWYTKIKLKEKYGNFIARSINLFYKLSGAYYFINKNLAKKANKIHGHSILAVYRKK